MNITVIQNKSQREILGSGGANIIEKLYELATDSNNSLTLEGWIKSPIAYGYQVDYLNTHFNDLEVETDNRYIKFEDPNMESYLASMGIGDNGKVTEAQAAAITVIANASNSTITKFNELKYFTNITESKDGWTGTSDGYARFTGWTALEEVDISNYTSLGHNNGVAWGDTFRGCTSLKKVTASNKLKKLGYSSFCYCSNLEEITGLSGTIELFGNVFQDCNKLKQSSIQNCTFTYSTNNNFTSLFRECHALTSISLDPSITKIPNEMFYRCLNLTNVSGLQNITGYDGSCFRECGNFEGPIDLTNVTYVKNEAFRMCNNLVCTGSTSNITQFGEYCLADCDMSGATVIVNANPSQYAFARTKLPATVTIGSQVTNITKAFSNAKGEFLVTGGASITSLESSGFRDSEVAGVSFSNVTSVGGECFRNCTKITNTSDIGFWSTLQTIDARAFYICKFAGAISLPNLTSIGEQAFGWCTGLTSVTFSGNTMDGPRSMFASCTNLSYVDLSGITSLGEQFFCECPNLQTIIGTQNITSIGSQCFKSSSVSNGLYFPNCITIGNGAFQSTNTPRIILPKVETVASGALRVSGDGINSVIELGDQLQQINNDSVSDNNQLRIIIRTSTVPTLDGTFYNNRWQKATIYVPRNMINSYKAASGWGSIQGQNGREVFYALEDSAYASPTWYQNV